MIASQVTSQVFTCNDSLVEAFPVKEGIEVVVPVTVDLASCLKEGVVSLEIEIVRRIDRVASSQDTVDQINSYLKNLTKNRETNAAEESVISSREVDVTVLMPNSVVAGRSYVSMSLAEISRLFAPRTALIPSQTEKVDTLEDRNSLTDRQAVLSLQDPSKTNLGSFPVDTVSAVSSTTAPFGLRVEALPVAAPESRIALADTSKVSVQAAIICPGESQVLGGSQIRVTAKNEKGEVQVVLLKTNVSELLTRNSIPSVAPTVTGNYNASGKAIIEIKQQDDAADSVAIAIRPIKDYNLPSLGFDTVVDSVLCKKGQTAIVQIDVAGPVIVRAHPTLSDKVSPVFGSAVLGRPLKGFDHLSSSSRTAIVAINSASGISIDFLTSDLQAARVLVKRRDLGNGSIVNITAQPSPIATMRGFIDSGVEDLARVQYTADLYRTNGDVIRSAASSDPIVRINPRGIVSADIVATPTIVGNQTVKIDINPAVKSNDVNFLINYIKGIGLEAAFQTDLETLKKSLLNCVKFDVTRFDLQTGEQKFVGQTSDTIVDDIDDVKVSSRFLYFCEAFVRSPSQLTDVIDDRANRPAGINPQITRLGLHITKADVDGKSAGNGTLSTARRFFSRSNFETGTMPAQPADDGFKDGRTGDVFSTRVAVNPVLPTVNSVAVRRANGRPVVEWSVSGDPRLIDRFEVMGQSSGSTWKVSSAGFANTTVTLQVVDAFSYSLPRYITYLIYPVYLDGKFGEPTISAPFLLEKVRKI